MPSSIHHEQFLNRFPEIIELADCTGAIRTFQISVRASEGYSYYFRGQEIAKSPHGYAFSAYSETSPIIGYSHLIMKIRKALAQRYLDPRSSDPSMLHNEMRGHVSSGGVVVDGRFIEWERFADLMQTHEGWEFKLFFSS